MRRARFWVISNENPPSGSWILYPLISLLLIIHNMVHPPNLEQRTAAGIRAGGHMLAHMAAYAMSEDKPGLIIMRGMCSREQHHAMLELIAFIVLDTSEGAVISGPPGRRVNTANMARPLYIAEVRDRLLVLSPEAFPEFFIRRMHKFLRQEKMPVDPSRRSVVIKAHQITWSTGCVCDAPWEDPDQGQPQACDVCEIGMDLLLRLGFIVRDNVLLREYRLIGDWWDFSSDEDDDDMEVNEEGEEGKQEVAALVTNSAAMGTNSEPPNLPVESEEGKQEGTALVTYTEPPDMPMEVFVHHLVNSRSLSRELP